MTKAVKIVLVGDPEIGKTSIIHAFTADKFTTDYTPTVFDNYNHSIVVDNVAVDLALWDASGSAEFDSLRPVSYAVTDVFLFCFAVDRSSSLTNIHNKWISEVQEHSPDTPILMVGTRSDMRDDVEAVQKMERQGVPLVSSAQVQAMVLRIGAVHYIECSARTRKGLREVFEAAVRIATYGPKKAFKSRESVTNLLSPRSHLRNQSISQSFPGRRFSLRAKRPRHRTDSRDLINNFHRISMDPIHEDLPVTHLSTTSPHKPRHNYALDIDEESDDEDEEEENILRKSSGSRRTRRVYRLPVELPSSNSSSSSDLSSISSSSGSEEKLSHLDCTSDEDFSSSDPHSVSPISLSPTMTTASPMNSPEMVEPISRSSSGNSKVPPLALAPLSTSNNNKNELNTHTVKQHPTVVASARSHKPSSRTSSKPLDEAGKELPKSARCSASSSEKHKNSKNAKKKPLHRPRAKTLSTVSTFLRKNL
eukprot:TRINITY_DN1167_c0_g1_i1.p1 TRINITY_DN1167_c0_g1~~TRINITY_DN1167_c0_g1_i1.p1  ORF type:complete len:478 (-),score=90.30 TRINITY_DN1167_c0_g1_i1:98-1531(-)